MIDRMLLRLAFCALVCLSVYGFYSGGLFEQTIWSPVGLERLILFAALYAGWFTAIILWRPRWFAPLTLLLALAYTIAVAGFGALASVLLFLFSSLVLGKLLLGSPLMPQKLRKNARFSSASAVGQVPDLPSAIAPETEALRSPVESATDDLLALLLGVSVYMWILGWTVHFPVNYPVTYLVLLVVPLVVGRRRTAACLRRCAGLVRGVSSATRSEYALLGMAVFVLLAHWLVTLKPEVGGDALAIHLVTPSWVAAHHRWGFDFRNLAWAVMPAGADWCFTAVYLLGGEYATRLLNLGMLLVTAALLFCAVRRWLAPGPALLMVALFAASPIVQLETGHLFVENLWMAALLGAVIALWRYRESGRSACLCLTGVLAGAGMAIKVGAVAFVAPLGVFAAAELYRRRKLGERGLLRVGLLGLACFLALASPAYLTAYLKTGNPVYPFLNATFRSPYFDSTVSLVDQRFRTPLGLDTLYDATFHTHHYLESQDGAFGFQYLLLAPLSLLLLRRNWPYLGWLALGVSVVFFVLTFQVQAYLRYIYPALPLWMILIALTAATLRARDLLLYRAVLGAALAVVFLDLYFLAASNWQHKDFCLNALFDPAEVGRYIDTHAPVRRLVAYLNSNHPDAAVAFFGRNQIAGLRGQAYTNLWHSEDFLRRLRKAGSAKDCLKLTNELSLRYFIAPSNASRMVIREVAVESFLSEFTVPEFTRGEYYVARLKEEYAGEKGWQNAPSEQRAPPVALSGSYDDYSPYIAYSGPWAREREFPRACNGTITHSNVAGAAFRSSFRGPRVTYVYTKAFNRGIAEVTIDGINKGRLDMYAPATIWQAQTSLESPGEGIHTLIVRILPQKNPASRDFYVDLDCLIVP